VFPIGLVAANFKAFEQRYRGEQCMTQHRNGSKTGMAALGAKGPFGDNEGHQSQPFTGLTIADQPA
jgi:hypothetical protein